MHKSPANLKEIINSKVKLKCSFKISLKDSFIIYSNIEIPSSE